MRKKTVRPMLKPMTLMRLNALFLRMFLIAFFTWCSNIRLLFWIFSYGFNILRSHRKDHYSFRMKLIILTVYLLPGPVYCSDSSLMLISIWLSGSLYPHFLSKCFDNYAHNDFWKYSGMSLIGVIESFTVESLFIINKDLLTIIPPNRILKKCIPCFTGAIANDCNFDSSGSVRALKQELFAGGNKKSSLIITGWSDLNYFYLIRLRQHYSLSGNWPVCRKNYVTR